MDSDSAEARQLLSYHVPVRLLLAAGALLVVAGAVYTVLHASTLYDEGGYLYEGWLVCARGLRPYLDFHTKVTPLLYFFYGVPQAAFGPSMLLGRLQAAATSLAAMGLAGWAIGRRYGLLAAAVMIWGFAAGLTGLDQHFRALAVAPCALWISLGVLGVSLQPARHAALLTGVAAGLLFLSRQDLIAPAIVLVALSGVAGKGMRSAGVAAAAAVVVAGLGLAPFLLSARSEMLSVLLIRVVRGRGAHLGPTPFSMTEPLSVHNLPWYLAFLAKVYIAPIIWLLAATVMALTKPASRILARHPVPVACLALAFINPLFRGAGALATHKNAFYLRDFYIEIALMAGAAAALVAAHRAAAPSQRRVLAVVGVIGVVLAPFAMRAPAWLRATGPTDLDGIREAGRFIAAETNPQDRVFALEDPHVFLEAGRALLPLLTHHLFLYHPRATTQALQGTKGFNLEMLMGMLRRDATVAVITERGMTWIAHNDRTTEGVRVVAAVRDELKRDWTLVAQGRNSFLGGVEIYRRTPGPSPGALQRSAPTTEP
jgi:hypothetical protein